MIGDVHEALARAFSTEYQQVIELRPRPSGDGAVVRVAVDADAAALVVTGNAALDVRVPRDALAVGYAAAAELPAGIVVRELRAQSGDVPLEVRVPRDARVSLVTRRRPIRLSADYDGASAWITVSGVPEVGAYRTEVLLDGRALGPPGPEGRVAVPLARRSRRVEARLFAQSGERLEPPRWRVALLPVQETPLGALDESLSAAAHKVARSGRHARFTLERAVVVAPPPPLPTTTQSADVIVPSGTQLLDGTLRLAVVSCEAAALLRGGAVLASPPADAVEHAHTAGYIGELVIPEAPSPWLRAVMALTVAALATAIALSPALFAASGLIAPAPCAESSATAAAGLALCAVGALLLARRTRSSGPRT